MFDIFLAAMFAVLIVREGRANTYVYVYNDGHLQFINANYGNFTSTVSAPIDSGAKCFLFHLETNKKSHQDAFQVCRNLGMQLASIESAQKNNAAVNYFIEKGSPTRRFWTSGTDQHEEGSWIWKSTGRPFAYQNWYNGQPYNVKDNILYHEWLNGKIVWKFGCRLNLRCSNGMMHTVHSRNPSCVKSHVKLKTYKW